ncbi:MAG: ferric reductase-like transmembrane domain-containing protein [Bdellovibrionaceae bacterium]|nr:ferric reductase-like transmembrane domain-containing protein [Pseudobdellovibrionaceae bacterium]
MTAPLTAKTLARVLKVLSLIPLVYWIYLIFADRLGADPAKTLNHLMGEVALYFLLLNLLVGAALAFVRARPVGLRALVLTRRFLGVWTFVILCGHVFLYLAYEGFEAKAFEQMISKPYLMFGSLAFLLLGLLAATSNDFSVRRLGGRDWKNIHRAVHLAAFLVTAHVLSIEKADLVKFGTLFALLWSVQLVRFVVSLRRR